MGSLGLYQMKRQVFKQSSKLFPEVICRRVSEALADWDRREEGGAADRDAQIKE